MCVFNQINSHFIDYMGVDFQSIICVNFWKFNTFFKLTDWFQTTYLYMI
jgi:hypothetical protein